MSQPAADMGTETVEAVRFGIYTDDEIRKLSVKKITNRELLNNVGQPELDGLYDPALGPFDDISLCKTCGQRSFYCTGHCGHIDLVQVVFHPLLFNMLRRILQKTCLKCFHFRARIEEVELCVAKLRLIKEGDIVGSRMLEKPPSMNSDSDHELGGIHASHSHKNDQCKWTSLQFTEAYSILNSFLKKRGNKCKCGAKNPAVNNPTFGWLQVNAMSDEDIRSNAMKGFMVDSPIEDDYDRSASEVENADSQNSGHVVSKKRKGKQNDTSSEFSKSKTKRSLLPAEVRAILARLWVKEAALCSFICDIQQHRLPSEKKFSFMMFFMNTLLVPPTKFRPPSKGGDSVMEHPQTILLQRILDCNKNLANAYEQDTDLTYAWLKLQQSINILFDSKSAAGTGQIDIASGICQLLEKKEGMFRQKMMGGRGLILLVAQLYHRILI